MFTTSRSAIVLLVFGSAILVAAGPPPALKDPFLDNLVGDWSVTRKMSNGRTIESTVRGEWVLKHQFIQLHYGAGEKGREYEAFVFIGFDDAAKSYVCHWVDVFGARYSALGHGKIDNDLRAIEFRFDPQTKTWTSLIRQTEKGEWKTFA